MAVEVAMRSDGETVIAATTLVVDGPGVYETLLELPALESLDRGSARFSLRATPGFAPELGYEVVRDVPVQPWGVERLDAAGGLLAGVQTLDLELPEGDFYISHFQTCPPRSPT